MISVNKPNNIPPRNQVRQNLFRLYNYKCAYCEKKIIEGGEIDHYRPQSLYQWLINDWTNLLPACSVCNKKKSNNFPLRNKRIVNPPQNLNLYYLQRIEDPLLLNPEYDNVEEHFIFYQLVK